MAVRPAHTVVEAGHVDPDVALEIVQIQVQALALVGVGVADKDVRILETMKANYGAIGEQVRLQWKEGLLVVEGGKLPIATYDRAAAESNAQRMFLEFLTRFNAEDRTVSPNPNARNYAPVVFSRLDESKPLNRFTATRRRLFENAMEELFKLNRIETDVGPKRLPPSGRSQCIIKSGLLI